MTAFKQKLFAFSALIAFIGLAIDIFLFLKLFDVSKRLQELTVEGQAIAIERTALEGLGTTIDPLKTQVAVIDETVPTTLDGFVLFVNDLSALATQSGVVLKVAIDKEPKEQKSGSFLYKTVDMTIELDSSYANLMSFLRRIYTIPYYFKIESMEIARNKDTEGVHASGKMTFFVK